ncbi:hypothetical protein MHYP_G00046820 [Metynnis hypsauchen]
MATECIKNCCRFFVTREKEPDPQIIKAPVPGKAVKESGWKKNVGVSEDYLLSKLPPDGKEVPFVLPSFRPSYIQPRGAPYPNYQGSAWATYVDRKAELAAAGQIVYDPNVPVLPGHVISFVSPGSVRRPILRGNLGGGASAWDQNGKQRLSASMLDLSSPHSNMQINRLLLCRISSFSLFLISESITLSGDERELGKVCVLLSYQEAVEQVWITVVQCKDLYVCVEGAEQPRVGIKGVITMARPVQFKTSIKDATPDMVFMETFVFSLSLEQLRSSALLLRLQTHTPRKRTMGECVLSLRTLGPQETQHWLDIRPPCKPRVCHAELQLATCFQPVRSRIQLQILSAQNLPSSSSLLTQSFFVKVEMFSDGRFILKRKTKVVRSSGGQVQWGESMLLPITNQDHNLQLAIKLYSRGSIRRKHLLGQVLLGFESPSPEAMEQWKDSVSHPEKIVTAWHRVRHS